MPPLRGADVRTATAYEAVRTDSRRALALAKRERRIALGELLTLVFENHTTVRGVVEEMLRSERIDDSDQLAGEIATFAPLVPGTGELCAMTVLEVADQAELSRRHAEMDGVTRAVRLEIGDSVVEAVDEHEGDPAAAGVGFLRFRLSEPQWRALRDPSAAVTVCVDHPAYRATTQLTAAQREALATDH